MKNSDVDNTLVIMQMFSGIDISNSNAWTQTNKGDIPADNNKWIESVGQITGSIGKAYISDENSKIVITLDENSEVFYIKEVGSS